MPGAIIPTIPSNWRSWQLCLPDDVAWRALGTGLVRLFCYRYFWDKTSGDVDAVTAKGQEILSRWLANECEGDPVCQLISDAIDAALNGNNPDLFFTTILDYVNEHCLASIFDAFSEFVESYLCFQLTHLFGSEAQLSEVISLFGLCGVDIVGYISGVRINNCVLQYQLNGSSTWQDATSLEACIKETMKNNPPQPGGMGILEQDNCQRFTIVVPANGLAALPAYTIEGTYLKILSVNGAWSPQGGVGGNWYCPDGSTFFLGQCTTGPDAADGSYPLPSGNKYELILTGADNHTARVGDYITLQTGGAYFFQMNDTDISNNQGSVIVEAEVCRFTCSNPEDIVTFNANNSATWLDPWTVEVDSNGYTTDAGRYTVDIFVSEPCYVRIAEIEELTTFNAVSGGWYDSGGVHGGHDCEGIAHLLLGTIGYQFQARTKDTNNSPNCGSNLREDFTLRIRFQNHDPV